MDNWDCKGIKHWQNSKKDKIDIIKKSAFYANKLKIGHLTDLCYLVAMKGLPWRKKYFKAYFSTITPLETNPLISQQVF